MPDNKTFFSIILDVRSLSGVKQQMCRLVPEWVTATVRVALLIDRSDTARSLRLGENAAYTCTNNSPASASVTCASKTSLQKLRSKH